MKMKRYIRSSTFSENISYEYDPSTKTLTISGAGVMVDYDSDFYRGVGEPVTTAPWKSYYRTTENVVIESGITSIGSCAFYGFYRLRSIKIPNSVTSIGPHAFSYCRSLTNIIIPDSVTSIGEGAFEGCNRLDSITIPDNLTNIGKDAFNETPLSDKLLTD